MIILATAEKAVSNLEGHKNIADDLTARLSPLLGIDLVPKVSVGCGNEICIEFMIRSPGIPEDTPVLKISQEAYDTPFYHVYIHEHFYHRYYILTTQKAADIQDAVRDVFHNALDCDFEMLFSVLNVGNYGLAPGERESATQIVTMRKE